MSGGFSPVHFNTYSTNSLENGLGPDKHSLIEHNEKEKEGQQNEKRRDTEYWRE